MIKPLYPRPYNQNNQNTKPSSKKYSSIIFNPYIIAINFLILIGIAVIFFHFFFERKLNISSLSTSRQIDVTSENVKEKKGGWFSFLSTYQLIRKKSLDIFSEEESKLLNIATESLQPQILKAENYRDKRRMYAIQKYEITRQIGRERENQIEEYYKLVNSKLGNEIKDALYASENVDNLAIIKLEKALEEHLQKHGAKEKDLDLLIYALQNLADLYLQKNLKDKAKKTYLTMFQLLKEKASHNDSTNYDLAISELEKLNTN